MATAGENMEQTRADADAAEKLDFELHIVRETRALMNSARALRSRALSGAIR
jgi:hypothetical protein